MSTRSQRGRAVRAKQNTSLRTFYILIGAVAVIAVAAFGVYALQNRQGPEMPAGILPTRPSFSGPVGVTGDGYYFKGEENAPVTVTEYADFQCPGCGYFTTDREAAFEQAYVSTGKVRLVYQEYPLNGHPNAVPAAEAARCAADQGGAAGFWKMHDMLFYNQRQWSSLPSPQAQFAKYADQLGLDKGAFAQCLADGKHRQAILAAKTAGDQMGLPGTPSFAVNGKLVDTTGAQSVDDIVAMTEAAIGQALAGQ